MRCRCDRYISQYCCITMLGMMLLQFAACGGLSWHRSESHALRAQQLQEDQRYIEAIAAYRLHMAERLQSRTADENPYFYLLLIGDCYAAMEQITEAEEAYLGAHAAGVDAALSSERLRRLAGYYEQQGEYQKAIDFLQKHRGLDPLLYDLEIDRLHKAFVRREIEDSERSEPSPEQAE